MGSKSNIKHVWWGGKYFGLNFSEPEKFFSEHWVRTVIEGTVSSLLGCCCDFKRKEHIWWCHWETNTHTYTESHKNEKPSIHSNIQKHKFYLYFDALKILKYPAKHFCLPANLLYFLRFGQVCVWGGGGQDRWGCLSWVGSHPPIKQTPIVQTSSRAPYKSIWVHIINFEKLNVYAKLQSNQMLKMTSQVLPKIETWWLDVSFLWNKFQSNLLCCSSQLLWQKRCKIQVNVSFNYK